MSDVNIKISVISQGAQKSLGALAKGAKQAEGEFKSLNLSVKQSTSAFKVFLGNVAAQGFSRAVSSLASGFATFAKQTIESTRQLEDLATQFEVLTGSVAGADRIIRDLQEFTARTPFQFESVAKAARTLLSFGFTADEVKTNLQDLGDVAAASGADLGEVSLIFGQVAAAGKLTGERLLQFQERAIPIGPALAKTLGIAESELRDFVSKGKVSFDEFEKAFQSLNEEGEFAFGGIDKASRTLSGRISTLRDNFVILQQSIGENFGPALKAIVSTLTAFVQGIVKSISVIGTFSEGGNFLIEVFAGIIKSAQFAIQIFLGFRAALNLLSAGFVALLSGAISAVEGLVKLAVVASQLAGVEFEGLNNAAQSLEDLRKTGFDTAESLVEDADNIVTSSAAIGQQSDELVKTLRKNFNEEVQLSEGRKTQAQIEADFRKKKQEEITQALSDEQRKRLEEKIKNDDALLQAENDRAQAANEAAFAQDGIITEREALQLQTLADLRATARENELLAAQSALGETQELEILRTKIQADQLKRRTAITLKEADLQRKERQRTLQQTASLFGALAGLAATGGAKLFKITQSLQLGQAIVSGVAAIQQAAASAPFPANLPAIAIETARAATSVIQIKQATPGFAEGGIVGGSSFQGDRLFARLNSGEMVLNRQQQANLFDMANGSGGGREIVVNTTVELDGEVLGRSISRQVADGLQLGEVV